MNSEMPERKRSFEASMLKQDPGRKEVPRHHGVPVLSFNVNTNHVVT